MQRDPNLIRDLLRFYESDCTIEYPAAENDAIRQSMCMLVESGYLAGHIQVGGTGEPEYAVPNDGRIIEHDGKKYSVFRVTSAGHDFLAVSRNDNIWKTTMKTLGSSVGLMTIDMLKLYLENKVKDFFGIMPPNP